MDKCKLVKKVIAKIERNGDNDSLQEKVDALIEQMSLPQIYKEPRNIIKVLQTFHKDHALSPQESLKLMGKIQQKGIITKSLRSNKDSEKAWRLLLKEWKIPNFRLERGAY